MVSLIINTKIVPTIKRKIIEKKGKRMAKDIIINHKKGKRDGRVNGIFFKLIFLVILFFLISQVSAFNLNNILSGFINKYFGEVQKFAHNMYVLNVLFRQGEDIIYQDLVELIVINPPIDENMLFKEFLKIVIPFYTLAIVGIGFFLIFISSSPAKSARAKSMLEKLVIGLGVTSISPKLIDLSLNLSEQLTYRILNLIDVSVYIEIIKDFTEFYSTLYLFVAQLNPTLGFITPGIWIWYVFWGAFTVILVRYISLTILTALFPFTVFFYSFEITRDLGRNMMEQTILWIAMQEFIASTVVATVLCLTTSGIEDIFNISGFGNFLLFVGAGFVILAPFMMTRIFRNFLPG